jgi:hypothetical protein
VACLLAACLLLSACSARQLTWAPPNTSGATIVNVTPGDEWYPLDPQRDYIINMPDGVYNRGGLTIDGGRNVTLIGGRISVPASSSTQLKPHRGLLLLNQRGTVHVEGLRIDGPGLTEGIQLYQPHGSTVHLQNIHIARVHHAPGEVNHSDVVQTWGGPKRLLIDGLTATTEFQGFMLQPTSEHCTTQACQPSSWYFRNVEIRSTPDARILFWKDGEFPIGLNNVWGQLPTGRGARGTVWPALGPWSGVQWGTPPAPIVDPKNVGLEYFGAPSYGG